MRIPLPQHRALRYYALVTFWQLPTHPYSRPTPLSRQWSVANKQMRMLLRVNTSIYSAKSNGLMYRGLPTRLFQVPKYILQHCEQSTTCNYQVHSLRLSIRHAISSRHWPTAQYIIRFGPFSYNSLFYRFPVYAASNSCPIPLDGA